MWTPYVAPGYTPELDFHLLVGSLVSFRTSKRDTNLRRSSFTLNGGVSVNGGYFGNSIIKSYWLHDKLRINIPFYFKNIPDHYWE